MSRASQPPDTSLNKTPPSPSATTPTVSPPPPSPWAPQGCSFICGGRRPATAAQTSSGTWGEKERGGQGAGRRGPRVDWDKEPQGIGLCRPGGLLPALHQEPRDPRGTPGRTQGETSSSPDRGARQSLATEGPGRGTRASRAPLVSTSGGPTTACLPVLSLSPRDLGVLPAPPYPMMSCRARSSGFSWYSMPCLAHSDLTRGAILCRLCRGMVGKRLGRACGGRREGWPTASTTHREAGQARETLSVSP